MERRIKQRGRKRARVPLSRERILQAAIAVVEQSGLEALSMRRLGEDLGVEAMSLYRHVANRDEILDGIAETVVGEIAVPDKDAAWKTAMRERALSAHAVLLRHPWAVTVIESRLKMNPTKSRYADAVLGNLRRAGFATSLAARAFVTLDSYIYGFVMQQVNWPFEEDEMPAAAAAFQAQLAAGEYPDLMEVMTYAMSAGASGGSMSSEFEFGLDSILDGFEKQLEAQRASAAPRGP